MNRINDWENLLKIANEELNPKGFGLKVYEPEEEGFYFLDIYKDEKYLETYAENYYEDELSDLLIDAWHYVNTEKLRRID